MNPGRKHQSVGNAKPPLELFRHVHRLSHRGEGLVRIPERPISKPQIRADRHRWAPRREVSLCRAGVEERERGLKLCSRLLWLAAEKERFAKGVVCDALQYRLTDAGGQLDQLLADGPRPRYVAMDLMKAAQPRESVERLFRVGKESRYFGCPPVVRLHRWAGVTGGRNQRRPQRIAQFEFETRGFRPGIEQAQGLAQVVHCLPVRGLGEGLGRGPLQVRDRPCVFPGALEVVCQHFRLPFADRCEVSLDNVRKRPVQLDAVGAQHRLVRHVLDQRVLKGVGARAWESEADAGLGQVV